MIQIHINKACAHLCSPPELLTAGMAKAVGVRFAFSEDWDGLTKTAVFSNGRATVDVLAAKWDGDTVMVAPEVLAVPGRYVRVGVYGTNASGVVLPTVWVTLGKVQPAAEPSGDPSTDPTLPVWAQLQEIIGDLNNLTTTAKENLVAAINEAAKTGSGGAGSIDLRTADGYIQYSNDGGATWENLIALADLKGEKGDTGAPGPQGVPGEQGPQGETGPQGPQGATGPAGPQGKTGPAGQDGAPGKDGSPGKDGADGAPGQDGFSPSASVAETATGATITITDKTGTTTAEIKNGKDGAPGKDGTNGKDGAPGAPGTPGTNGTDGKDGTTFTPSVSAAGDLSWTNDGGKANPAPVNLKGPPGADYTLTDADKTEIAAEAAAAIAGTSLPAPASAAVGQIVKIKAVDAAGKITETEAVDLPTGGEDAWEEIYSATMEEEVSTFDADLGKSYKKIIIAVNVEQMTITTNRTIKFVFNNYDRNVFTNNIMTSARRSMGFELEVFDEFVRAWENQTSLELVRNEQPFGAAQFSQKILNRTGIIPDSDTGINHVNMSTLTSFAFQAGEKIKIYGVEA